MPHRYSHLFLDDIFFQSQVPIFMISETAEEIITFTNALPEWLCKSRQEKVLPFTLCVLKYESNTPHHLTLMCGYPAAFLL